MMTDAHADLEDARLRLQAARHRAMVVDGVRGVVWSITSALAAVLALELAGRLAPDSVVAVLGRPYSGEGPLVGLSVFLLGLVATGVLSMARAPTLMVLARRADRRFALRERVSTALEVVSRDRRTTDPQRAVSQAMVHSAAAAAGQIDPTRLVPFKVPKAAYLVPVLLLAIAFVALTLPLPSPSVSGPARASIEQVEAPLADTEREGLAQEVERAARQITEQAGSDDYLGAIGRTLDDLGRRMRSDTGVTRDAIYREVVALAQYARATGTDPGASDGYQQTAGLLDSLSESVEASRPAGGRARDIGSQAGGGGADTARPRVEVDGATSDTGEESQPQTAVSEAMSQMTQEDLSQLRGEGQVDGQPPASAQGVAAQGAYVNTESGPNRPSRAEIETMSQEGASPYAGQLLGPSQSASAGDSVLAGQGSQDLTSEGREGAEVAFSIGDELVLEGRDTGGGRRVSIQIAPRTQRTDLANRVPQGSGANWQQREEAQVSRPDVGLAKRGVVSRYFQGLIGQDQQGDGEQ